MGAKNQIQRKILFRNNVFLGRDHLYYAKLSEEKFSFNSDLCLRAVVFMIQAAGINDTGRLDY